MRGTQSNAKTKIDGAECEGASSRRSGPLNRYAPKELDCSCQVYENFALRNIPQRTNLLPVVKITPDQGDDAKTDGSQSKRVTS